MSLNITDHLADALRQALDAAGLPAPSEVQWEIPREARHGDYATNVAMTLAREARRPPRKIAEAIVVAFPRTPAVDRLEIAGPGFLNVFLSPAWCASALHEVLAAGDEYGRSDVGKGARVLLEFVSANPTGPLVIVNARAAAVGDALARILRAQGYAVETQYYVNDAGNQFEALARSVDVRLRQALGEAVELPENAYPGEYVVDLVAGWLARDREGVRALATRPEAERLDLLGRRAVAEMVESQRRVLEAYGTRFDHWAHEQRDVRDTARPREAIEALARAGHTYEQDGALWFRSTAFGDDKDRPLVKTGGELTYFAADVAYHRAKYGAGYDRIIDVWGADHHGHVPRMKAALSALGLDPARLEVVLVQIVSLTRGGEPVRMGKRSGEFVTLREVVDEVGADATRFFLLMRKSDAQLEFDLDLAKQRTAENPVFYVQYAHARVASIFRAAHEVGLDRAAVAAADPSRLVQEEELALIRRLAQFPEIVEGAALELEPHRVVFFLMELAGEFHRYYNRTRILGDDRDLAAARLMLAANVQKTIRAGLAILGISAPDSM